MKNKYITGTLILLFLFICGILIKADSQIQSEPFKFKVGVKVSCEQNLVHQSLIERIIKRELRSFGDVQIVAGDTNNPLWDWLIKVHLIESRGSHSNNLMGYATSIDFYVKIPIKDFVPDQQAFYRRNPAVLLPYSYIGTYGLGDLEKLGETAATEFDKMWRQRVKDHLIRNSK